MKLEHVGYNVAEPQKLMDWWCANLGFKQVHPAFIVDSTGQTALEFYNNPDAPVPDWANMNPLSMHIAFLSDDVDAEATRLWTPRPPASSPPAPPCSKPSTSPASTW